MSDLSKTTRPPQATLAASRYLLPDYPLIVLPTLAATIGLNRAIVLQQIHFLLGALEGKTVENRHWIYMPDRAWRDQFPFWGRNTIRNILKGLEKDGLLLVGKFNENPFDQTLWYTIDYEKLDTLPARPPRKQRADYPNFGQAMQSHRTARSTDRSSETSQTTPKQETPPIAQTPDNPDSGSSKLWTMYRVQTLDSDSLDLSKNTISGVSDSALTPEQPPSQTTVTALPVMETATTVTSTDRSSETSQTTVTSPQATPTTPISPSFSESGNGHVVADIEDKTVGPARPESSRARQSSARAPNPIFDAIALGSFNLPKVGKQGGRVGRLVAGIKECVPPEHQDTLAADLTAMYAWYKKAYPGLDAPATVETICKYLSKWRACGGQVSPPVNAPGRDNWQQNQREPVESLVVQPDGTLKRIYSWT
jgi:hypothetical protein